VTPVAERARLADWLEPQIFGAAPFSDVLAQAPDLGEADAYRIRAELVARRCAAGDALAGYKVAGSSRAIRADEHVEGPLVGCIMRSRTRLEADPIRAAGARLAIEPEVGVMLKRDLVGPGVTVLDAIAATEAVFPAFEILSLRGGPRPSHQARIVASNFSGLFVFGGPMTKPHGIDLRVEGMVLYVNGEPRGSACGVEVLGDPVSAIALVANTLALSEQSLTAGMVIMTGSFLANTPIAAGDRAEASFTRLGTIATAFAP